MASLRNYGVGTGYTSDGITGKKNVFSKDETVFACHVWDNLSGGETFHIIWEKLISGSYVEQYDMTWTNPGYKWAYQYSSWKDMPTGKWRCRFLLNSIFGGGKEFTVKAKAPPSPPPSPPEEKAIIEITSEPSGASIFVDGVDIKNTTGFSLVIEPGYHEITVKLAGYKDMTTTGYFAAGHHKPATLVLEKIKAPPKKTWWEKLLTFIVNPALKPYLTSDTIFKKGYKLLTGKEITDAEFEIQKLKLADWILPINEMMILFEGKNLKGETQTTLKADNWLNVMLSLAAVIPAGKVGGTAAKFAAKSITKAEAAKLTAEFGKKTVVDNLIRVVKASPTTSAKFLSKFPQPVRDAVFKGLGKTGYGREVIYTLGKTGYYKYSAPAWKQAIMTMMDWSKPIIAITLPIFAITEIPNLLNMWQFARKQKLEAEGKWPSDIAYKLSELEDLMKSYTFDIDKKIVAKDKEKADDLLKKLMSVIEEYRNYAEEKREDMLPENYDLSLLALEFYEGFVSDRMEKIAKLPEAAPPEIKTGKLILSVEPSDAEIEVAGQPEITASGTYELDPGSYVIKASKENYWDKSSTAIIKAGEETKTSITLTPLTEPAPPLPPEEIKGTLTISATPKDALIEVAGEEEITTTGTYSLSAGNYSVRASKEGYETKIKTAIVNEGKDTVISFTLAEITPPKPITKKATIKITSEPTNADVYIDGEYAFTKTPYTILLTEGSYFVRVQKEGYYPTEVEIEVEAGEVSELPLVLTEIPPEVTPPAPYYPQTPYYPTYEPPAPYIPSVITTPPVEIPPYNYDLLYEPVLSIPEPEPVSKPTEKELLINIETTDVKPWKGRIYSIAALDLSDPTGEILMFINNNEQLLIEEFLTIFNTINPAKLVGFKLSFDYRYIFAKMMLYRITNKKYYNVELRDVKQILDQVKEEFVYYPDKKGTLDDWGKMLLGKGKYGSQELMLRKYISGDFDYVKAFQERQIELTRDLYNLARFSMGEAFISHSSPVSAEISPIPTSESVKIPESQTRKQCPVCFAYIDKTTGKCPICEPTI